MSDNEYYYLFDCGRSTIDDGGGGRLPPNWVSPRLSDSDNLGDTLKLQPYIASQPHCHSSDKIRDAKIDIIDPLEVRPNRPKEKSRRPPKKLSPPTKSFETFDDRLSVDDLAWELVARNDRRSSTTAGRDHGGRHPPHSISSTLSITSRGSIAIIVISTNIKSY